jgi:papain like protease
MPHEKYGLGRIPSPPDSRDFRLGNFLVPATADPVVDPAEEISLGLTELSKTTVKFSRWAATVYPDITQTHWWKALNHFQRAKDALTDPSFPPAGTNVIWTKDDPTLNQEDTGHCVGFSGAQWSNTEPVDGEMRDPDGHALYYECKIVDGDPGAENGSYMRSLGEVLVQRGRADVYAFASTLDEVQEWVRTKGPVLVGTTWHNDMFDPDANGFVSPTGGVAGGHAYVLVGDLPDEGAFLFLNSWGSDFADGGYFKIRYEDFRTLMDDYGEIVVAIELPL